MKTNTISSFEIVDHGVDGSQYFQGCGVAFTPFDSVQTGCGENAKEAFEDALEQIAMSESVDLSTIEHSREGKRFLTKRAERASVAKYLRQAGIRGEDASDELYYYVSIRYSLGASEETALRSAGLHPSQTGRRATV